MAEDKMEVEQGPTVSAVAPPAPTAEPAEDAKPKPADSLRTTTALLEHAVKAKETRLISGRVLRLTAAVRPQLTADVLRTYISATLSPELAARDVLLQALDKVPVMPVMADATPVTQAASSAAADVMQTDAPAAAPATAAAAAHSSTPEVEMLAYLLTTTLLLDTHQYEVAQQLSSQALARLAAFNRRTLDVLAARLYSLYSLAHERLGRLAEIRSPLLALHRTASLRHDAVGQETLLNLLLRNYLHYSLYDQAEKLRSKAAKTDAWRSHSQYIRYLYYLGRIRAVQLEYTEARDCLQQASRKAPTGALAFRVSADKWLILVRLLLGEVPERVEFSVPGLSVALQPYYQLTQAVRSGDLVAFAQVAEKHSAVFQADRTAHLVTRLHHNVLRTGLRRISLAYSRISLADVAARLHVPSAEDAECLVAKAIRDGGVDAVIDHEAGTMVSKAAQDVYVSGEPTEAFHARIAFCLDLHNEAVKALRYEPDGHRKTLETPEARAERMAAEAELAAALEEDEDF